MLKTLGVTLLAAALSVPLTAGGPGVDPDLLALTAPDAKTLIGVQVSQAQATPFGRYLMSQLQLDQDDNKAMAAMGFDPRRDLREILASSRDGLSNGVLLGRGSFRSDKLAAAGIAAGGTRSSYRGVQLIEGKASVAFLDASTIVVGDSASVKAAIDRHASGAAVSGTLAERARLISAANDAWVVMLTPPSGSPAGAALGNQLGPLENLLQSALQLSAGLKLTATQVTLSADVLTRSPQDAQSMADLLKFGVGLLQSNGARGPNPSPGAALAGAAQISSSGPLVHLVLPVPEPQMEQFFQQSPGPPKKLAAR